MVPFSAYNNSQEINLFERDSNIPYLFKDQVQGTSISGHHPSLFFKCYSDEIYEAILEDLRAHYIAISNQDLDEMEDDEEGEYTRFDQIPAVGGPTQ